MAEKQKKLFIKTWGCQMNVYDSVKMSDVLLPLGYETVDSPENADMVILNTCHIREKATEKVFSELGRLNKFKKQRAEKGDETLIAVAGCVAQAEGDVIMDRAPYVDMVFGPQTYHELPEMVAKATGAYGANRIVNTEFPMESKFDSLPEEGNTQGVSAFLSVQEGCDKFCTFCVVPYTRGAEFSRPAAQVLAEARALVKSGTKELMLLGQNVNAYHGEGPDGKTWGLGRLIREMAEIDGLARLRYTTSHPRDMEDDLIAAHGEVDILMPFLHLPVQSGSDNILKLMNRKHTADDYRAIIEKLRKARPDIAMSSDFIVGFPGETDADHKDTLKLVEDIGYVFCYSFKYSPRPGTPGAKMGGIVPEKIKDVRLQELQALLNAQQKDYNLSTVGKTLPVLFDRKGQKDGQLLGKTPYMQSVHVTAHDRLQGQIADVMIETALANSLSGAVVTTETTSKNTKHKNEGREAA
ncbi:MAG: tRNA (N6-isopentenyl adenosine(37)-C2)-methylthiotransferase MiaB [Pseudomonadota bacterium]|mgnify:CR=1 FL=1|jgi:tRNA-2-methylthio-N6-dimethylallyladenosine synthase|nr:tRNA (N6-isopentenyl adenosine(37)-C2)-methylthiotransferase MiaB [Pseudomonadota bacterium]QKK05510.1 MAG: tRNA (N6-isopentenyl adenosine(37)-C2)-methylthiotransferase MiaB [Pseudomonadota bacterium]